MENINIELFDEYYMFCNNGNYFKIGLFEGKILSDILHGKGRETIIEEENLTESEFDYIMNAFEEAGIWEPDKKEKFIQEWQDGRSSINDIGTYAHKLGKKMME